MKRVTALSLCFLFFGMAPVFGGCAEPCSEDCFEAECACVGCSFDQTKNGVRAMRANQNAYMSDQIDTSDACLLLADALVGQWEANLPTGHVRYDFGSDGRYALYREKNNKWARRDTGTYRIAYRQIDGLLRAELYMSVGDDIEYPTAFYVQNGHLMLEAGLGDMTVIELSPYRSE